MRIVSRSEFEVWLTGQLSQENLRRALEKAQEDGKALLGLSEGEVDAANHTMLNGISKRLASIMTFQGMDEVDTKEEVSKVVAALSEVIPFGQEISDGTFGKLVIDVLEKCKSQLIWAIDIGSLIGVLYGNEAEV